MSYGVGVTFAREDTFAGKVTFSQVENFARASLKHDGTLLLGLKIF